MTRFPAERRAVSSSSVLVLSFLWPGLGQWVAGRRRTAIVFAAPVAVAAFLAVYQLLGGVERLAIELLTPEFALAVLTIVLLLGILRLVAMADGPIIGLPDSRQPRPVVLFGILAVVVVLVHAAVGYYAWSFYDAGHRIFVADLRQTEPDQLVPPTDTPVPGTTDVSIVSPLPGTTGQPAPSATEEEPVVTGPQVSGTPAPDQSAVPAPAPTPAANGRLTVLISGVDSGQGRDHALNDTLIVASIDPQTGKVAMMSLPRDIAQFPLWDGRIFLGKINSLASYAAQHPGDFPDGGAGTLMREVAYLIGIPVHYYAAVNLDGFPRIVDAVGGIDVVNDQDISDPVLSFRLSAGQHHLDGRSALLYVRSRSGPGDSDFTRAMRQQQVLSILAHRIASPNMLPQIPRLLELAGQTVRTTFPSSRVADALAFVREVPDGSISRYVLGPPYSEHPPLASTGGVWILRLDLARVGTLSVQLFGSDSRYAGS